MIEVMFGESEAGSMKSTKREVICLGFMLDIGDIKENIESEYRKELIYQLYYQDQWEHIAEVAEELKETGSFYVKELEKLKAYIEAGEDIRIWYSDSPYSRCGFYHLCHWLEKCKNSVSVVKLPEYRVKGNVIISYHNWGEVDPEELSWFFKYEKPLTMEERRMYAYLWKQLVKENTPLRAVINGRVTSVEADFYDFLIWKRLTHKPIKQARLIGDILGMYPVAVRDWWYAKRIEKYIDLGQIKVVEDSEMKYARTICLAERQNNL